MLLWQSSGAFLSKIHDLTSPMKLVSPPAPGMISLLLSGLYIQVDSCWLSQTCECYFLHLYVYLTML